MINGHFSAIEIAMTVIVGAASPSRALPQFVAQSPAVRFRTAPSGFDPRFRCGGPRTSAKQLKMGEIPPEDFGEETAGSGANLSA
jgi:hypothetical protein